ncbi:hypothetical protein D3C80_453020 [compost metagenome]
MHEKMLAHGFTGTRWIAIGDGVDNGHVLFERRPDICSAAPGEFPYRLPGIILADTIDDIENREKQLVAGALGDLAMERPIPQFLGIGIRALAGLFHQRPHALHLGRLGAHRR